MRLGSSNSAGRAKPGGRGIFDAAKVSRPPTGAASADALDSGGLWRDTFNGPDAEFRVFVADLSAVAIGGREGAGPTAPEWRKGRGRASRRSGEGIRRLSRLGAISPKLVREGSMHRVLIAVFAFAIPQVASAAPMLTTCPTGYKSYSSAPPNSSGWSKSTPCCKPVAPGSILNCTARVPVKPVDGNQQRY